MVSNRAVRYAVRGCVSFIVSDGEKRYAHNTQTIAGLDTSVYDDIDPHSDSGSVSFCERSPFSKSICVVRLFHLSKRLRFRPEIYSKNIANRKIGCVF